LYNENIKDKKNLKKRFISKKKQLGKGFTQKNSVPILPFHEKLLDKIMKDVICTCDLKLSANYDKRSFQFYNPNRELMFDNNILISRLIIKDDDVFTDKELSEIQKCIYLVVSKYQELDDDLDEEYDVCRKMWSTDLQIGDRVITCGESIYSYTDKVPVPLGTIGTIVNIIHRYKDTPNPEIQYKVKFDDYKTLDGLEHLYWSYNLRRV